MHFTFDFQYPLAGMTHLKMRMRSLKVVFFNKRDPAKLIDDAMEEGETHKQAARARQNEQR